MSVDLSVVFPAFNEEQRLAATLRAFAAFLAQGSSTSELLVVDDGSSDGTCALVRELAQYIPTLRLIECGANNGKGHAIRVGMRQAQGRICVMSDADGSTPPTELPKLLEPLLKKETDVTIGSRYVAGAVVETTQPLYRRVWSRLANRVIRVVLLPGIADTHCGFKAFTSEAANYIFSRAEIDGWSFDLEALALARVGGFSVVEVPVRWKDDARSRANVSHAPGAIMELLRIRKKIRRLAVAELMTSKRIDVP